MATYKLKKLISFSGARFILALVFSSTLSSMPGNAATKGEPDWQKITEIAKAKSLEQHPQWLRLGHYRCRFSKCTSEQDGAEFFLSPNGRTDPKGELEATLENFRENRLREIGNNPLNYRVRCQFPARLQWIAEQTGGWDAESLLTECEALNKFRTRLDAARVSLVFSSYYLNNPSSTFGHTLLKVDSRSIIEGSQQADLLSYGVNYAANPTVSNPVLYALMGLAGGFVGTFASLPYYYKVREYNDFESRDLWEYQLNLTQPEVDQMIRHLWELGLAEFDYFYLTENCSYHLLSLLDVAAPRLNLAEPLPYWVIPVDTVVEVSKTPGLVSQVKHRHSISQILEARFDVLTKSERNDFFKVIRDYKMPPNASPNLTDAVIDHFDMNNGERLLKKDPSALSTKHELLVFRSRLPSTAPVNVPPSVPPDHAHPTMRILLGAGERVEQQSAHFGVRFSLHDLTDRVPGSPPYARLEMFNFDFMHIEGEDRPQIDRFRFVGIEAMNSWSELWRQPAWRFDLGGERITDSRCADCFATILGGAIGLSRTFSKSYISVAPYAYLNLRNRIGRFESDNFSIEGGPSVGIRFLGPKDINFLAEYESRHIDYEWETAIEVWNATLQAPIRKNLSIRGDYLHRKGEGQPSTESWTGSMLLFY